MVCMCGRAVAHSLWASSPHEHKCTLTHPTQIPWLLCLYVRSTSSSPRPGSSCRSPCLPPQLSSPACCGRAYCCLPSMRARVQYPTLGCSSLGKGCRCWRGSMRALHGPPACVGGCGVLGWECGCACTPSAFSKRGIWETTTLGNSPIVARTSKLRNTTFEGKTLCNPSLFWGLSASAFFCLFLFHTPLALRRALVLVVLDVAHHFLC